MALVGKENAEVAFHFADVLLQNCELQDDMDGGQIRSFIPHDPLAKAAKSAGLDIYYLDFAKAAESPELVSATTDYTYMGTLGEGYSLLNRILPPSYRIFQSPSELYDGMIFVSDATPTTILDKVE